MGWQAFSWAEIQARSTWTPERLLKPISMEGPIFEALSLVTMFLTPFAFMEAALGCWRLGADLGLAGAFFINVGLLSHWQVWFALAAFTQLASSYLNRLLARQAEFTGKQN